MIEREELPALPVGFSWGERQGNYWPIHKGEKRVAQFGGMLALAAPRQEWPDLVCYSLAQAQFRGELE